MGTQVIHPRHVEPAYITTEKLGLYVPSLLGAIINMLVLRTPLAFLVILYPNVNTTNNE